MYLNFFNLKREPFDITPDPELLYLSPSHKEALAAVIYGVNKRKGFVEIIGEVGVGKTTIIRSFLDRIDKQNISTIYIFNANISFKSLLRTIYQNLKRVPQTDDVSEMVDQLHMILIDEYKAGRNVVLIIDEAQNMPVETLENLRMLSNLETSTDKLIQIVFSGQPEFEERLKVYALRQLRQRIAMRVKIMPLSRAESLAYIDFRLGKSLIKNTSIFTRGALDRIAGAAGGIPRIINIFCDNCLITSFGNQQKKVTSRVAREIIAEHEGGRQARQSWMIAVTATLLVAVCTVLFYGKNVRTMPASASPAADTKPVVPVAVASSVQAVPPAPIQPVMPVSASPIADKQPVAPAAVANSMQTVRPAPVRIAKEPSEGASTKHVTTQHERAETEDVLRSGSSQLHRVARRGDTLAKLVLETYGTVDRKLLEQVKQRNPGITNINVIQEGERIYFPTRDKR